jgi:hypothetical protein
MDPIQHMTGLPLTPYFKKGRSIYGASVYIDRAGNWHRPETINFFVVEIELDGERKQRRNFNDFGHFVAWSAEATNRGHNITNSTILPDLRCAAGNL